MRDYDVVVVGGGAAGLSAALVLARARRTVAVVDAGGPRNAPAAHMHGFLSRDGMPPHGLVAAGRAEVAGYGGSLIDDTVVDVAPGFHVRLVGGSSLHARRILIATGLRDQLPDIPGVRERWGRDLLHYLFGDLVRTQGETTRNGVVGTARWSVGIAGLVAALAGILMYLILTGAITRAVAAEIGRASCRERV